MQQGNVVVHGPFVVLGMHANFGNTCGNVREENLKRFLSYLAVLLLILQSLSVEHLIFVLSPFQIQA